MLMAEAIDPEKQQIVLRDLEATAVDLAAAQEQLTELKVRRDLLVAAARDERVPYADIANKTGMSISWINASLVRTDGYRPRAGRPRRREGDES